MSSGAGPPLNTSHSRILAQVASFIVLCTATTVSISFSLAPSALSFRTNAFQNIWGEGYCHRVPSFWGMVEACLVLSKVVVWPGARACCGVRGMLFVPLMGQLPPLLFDDFMGQPSACATRATAVAPAADATDDTARSMAWQAIAVPAGRDSLG